jgi:hypothetical protein
MRELGPVKVEPKGSLRAVLHALQPKELRFRVDEATDEPGRGDAINPQMLTRRPGAPGIVLGVSLTDLAVCGVRLVGRKPRVDRGLGIGVLAPRGDSYASLNRFPTHAGARTGLFIPEIDRLIVAARASGSESAAVWVLRPLF